MKLGNTVYRVSAYDCQVSHLDLIVVEDSHAPDLGLNINSCMICVLAHDLINKSSVDLINDLINSRKKSLEKIYRPLLKGFSHDGMVRVTAGLKCYIPCLIPGQVVLIHK